MKNSGSSDIGVFVNSATFGGTAVPNVYIPSDGISVPAGWLCEIGVVGDVDGVFITSRNDLSL